MSSTPSAVAKQNDGNEPRTDAKREVDSCCKIFEPARFDKKEIVWNGRPFIKDGVWCILHVPINFGGMVSRVCAKIDAAGAKCRDDEFVMLADIKSSWSSTVYFSVTKDNVPGAIVTRISGTFLTKVFEGPYSDFGKWIKEMESFFKSRKGATHDFSSSELFAFYATCPKCSKKHGKNYTVLFSKVA